MSGDGCTGAGGEPAPSSIRNIKSSFTDAPIWTAPPSRVVEQHGAIWAAWYPVLRSSTLKRSETARTRLHGQAIGLRHTKSGVVAWRLDTGASVAVEVHLGLVWLCLAEPEHAPTLPDGTWGEAHVISWSEVEVRSDFDQAVLGLVDPAHVPMVHRSWWWRPPSRARRVKTKHYFPSEYGFTARSGDEYASAPLYRVLGRPSISIGFRLPGLRCERILTRHFRLSNLTTVTPINQDAVILRNIIYSNRSALKVLAPLLSVLGRGFLKQDARLLEMLPVGALKRAPILFVGDADTPSAWYFRLKAALTQTRRTGRAFANPVTARSLRWNTCWLFAAALPL